MSKDNGSTATKSRIKKADHDENTGHEGPLDLSVELGVTGLQVSAGQIMDQMIRQLRGHHRRALTIFEEMARYDDVVGGMLYAIEMLIRQVEWRTEPGSDDPADIEAAEFIDSLRQDMSTSWEDTVAEVLSMIWAGWSYHEIVYKRRVGQVPSHPGESSRFTDGRIGWRKLPIRGQPSLIRWEFDPEGGVRGMWQRDPNPSMDVNRGRTEIFIPIEKALLFRPHVTRGSPEGRSMLERAFISWYYKKKLTTLESIGVERDLAGIPMAWVPPGLLASGATGVQKATLASIKEMVVNVRRDEQEGIVMPLAYDANGNKLYDFELLTSGGSRQIDPDVPIARHNRGIAGAVLAEFMLLGSGSSGSFAMHKDKTALFLVGLGALLGSIKAVFNRHAIPRVLILNGMSVENPPTYQHGEIERVDLEELGKFLGALTAAGAPLFPDDTLENYLRSVASLPERVVEDVL